MSRWVGACALIAVAVFSVFPRMGEAPSAGPADTDIPLPSTQPGSSPERTAPRGDSVVIEHEVIEVAPPIRRAPPLTVRATRASRPTTLIDHRGPDFVKRARRALVGDGRFRPQPFPQPSVR